MAQAEETISPRPGARPDAPRWLAPSIDYGPLAIFFLVYCVSGVLTATAAMLGATIAALILSLVKIRRIPSTTLAVSAMVLIFGGLTLWLSDERYLELQSTLINGAFALLLFGAFALRRPLLRTMLGTALRLSEAGWRTLTLRFALFFAVMAALNELIAQTQTTEFWAAWYSIGTTVLTLGFLLAQWPLVNRHGMRAAAPSPNREPL